MNDIVKNVILGLLKYCITENWAGYDPYDALNSRLFAVLPLSKSRLFRLMLTQVMKRSPINLRPLFLIPKEENPKACALFCSSLIRLSNIGVVTDDSLVISRLSRLIELRSTGYTYFGWGYNFDWQSRGFLLPKFTPNIICTTFSGNALLDAYVKYGKTEYLETAVSAGKFIINGLNITQHEDTVCFSYTPIDHSHIHNANLLGAAFLGRLFSLTRERIFYEIAEKAARFSINKQNGDGSWPYGENKAQSWIDNFHTGYNLVALNALKNIMKDSSVSESLLKGYKFYIKNFFTLDGIAKYYHDRVWPVDIHSVAQSLITLCECSDLHESTPLLVKKIFYWSIENLKSDKGYFFYQKTRLSSNKISYMRWAQAWMLYALSILIGFIIKKKSRFHDYLHCN